MYNLFLKKFFLSYKFLIYLQSLNLFSKFLSRGWWSCIIVISLCIISNWKTDSVTTDPMLQPSPVSLYLMLLLMSTFVKFYHDLLPGRLAAQIQLLQASRSLFKLFLMSMIQLDVRNAKRWPFLSPAAQPSVSTRLMAPAILHWPSVLLQGAYLSAVLN